MIDLYGVKKRVAAGASRLDEVVPGWHEMIDLDRLSINDHRHCVLGQIYGDFNDRDVAVIGSILECVNLGFYPRGNPHSVSAMIGQGIELPLLDRAWRREIGRRRVCATTAIESTARR